MHNWPCDIDIKAETLWDTRPKALDWFSDYLSERYPKTCVNGVLSDFHLITCGIPQGSILGPILFLLYINDLPNSNLLSNVRMYTDDTSLTYASDNLETLTQIMSCGLTNVFQWLNANKLSLNISETKCMFLGATRQKHGLIQQTQISIYSGTPPVETDNGHFSPNPLTKLTSLYAHSFLRTVCLIFRYHVLYSYSTRPC